MLSYPDDDIFGNVIALILHTEITRFWLVSFRIVLSGYIVSWHLAIFAKIKKTEAKKIVWMKEYAFETYICLIT